MKRFGISANASRIGKRFINTPHGGKLQVNMAGGSISGLSQFQLNSRQLCDIELLCNGGFSPLAGPMDSATYNSVVENLTLPDGDTVFGLPVVFDVAEPVAAGTSIALMQGDHPIAILDVTDCYKPDRVLECNKCYGVTTVEHPGVRQVWGRGEYYLGGTLRGINLPKRGYTCKTPEQVRAQLDGFDSVVAFQARNPLHRVHYELVKKACDAPNVTGKKCTLVHPTMGPTQDEDIPGDIRYITYESLQKTNPDERVQWAYLPYNMHLAGPREAVQHMLVRRNYGATHFVVGRDMAGSKSSLTGDDFYGDFDAQNLAAELAPKLNMQTVPSPEIVFTEEEGFLAKSDAKAKGLDPLKLSGTKFRKMLREGADIPEWFSFPDTIKTLRAYYASKQ